jgi:hypothetical protein
MKNKQIKIWLEVEPFNNKLVIVTEYCIFDNDEVKMFDDVKKILKEKVEYNDYIQNFYDVKPNESRETIIEALYEYQMKLLKEVNPKSPFLSVPMSSIGRYVHAHHFYRFYDAET